MSNHEDIAVNNELAADGVSQTTSYHDQGFASYPVDNNPYPVATHAFHEWDKGYWAAHDADADFSESNGIEDGYGDFYDFDAVSQGMYDDDPSPYNGDYSEM